MYIPGLKKLFFVLIGLALTAGAAAADSCPECKQYEAWLKENAKACGYHGARLPSICNTDPECLRWNEQCGAQKKALQQCLDLCRAKKETDAQIKKPDNSQRRPDPSIAKKDSKDIEPPTHNEEWCREKTKELFEWDPKNFPHGIIGWIEVARRDVELELCGGVRRSVNANWRQETTWVPIMIGDCIRTGKNGVAKFRLKDGVRYGTNIPRNSNICFDHFWPMTWQREQGWSGPRISDNAVGYIGLIRGAIRTLTSGWRNQSFVRIKFSGNLCSIGGTPQGIAVDPDRTEFAYQAGPTDSDVIIDYDPDHERADVYVSKGSASLSNPQTGETRVLTEGTKIMVQHGEMGPVEKMSSSEWDGVLTQNGLRKTAADQSAQDEAASTETPQALPPEIRDRMDKIREVLDRQRTVTEHVQKLREQYAKLQFLNTQLDEMLKSEAFQRMDRCNRDPAVDAAIITQNLYLQSKAFYDLLREFQNSKTRHGLLEELELIGKSGTLISEMVDKHSRLKNVKHPPIGDREKDRIRRAFRKKVLDLVRDKLSRKLKSKGLKDLLTAESWQELLDKAVFHVHRKVKETIEREMEHIFGLRFHDAESAQRALRQKARLEVGKAVAKLLVKITSNELILEFAGGAIMRWLERDIWPKIREFLRPKGNLDERTTRSVATMEAAILRLQKHGSLSEEERGKATNLHNVRRSVEAALATVHAARYLKRDIARRNREDLKTKLKYVIKRLERWIALTEFRFLLYVDEQGETLESMENTLKATLSDLSKITGRNEDGSPGPVSAFFIVRAEGTGYIPHWHGGSYEVAGSDQFIFELKRGQDLEGALSAYMASMIPDICEIKNPGGFIEPKARPTVWNSGPKLTVVCGPFFDRTDIDKDMINNLWKDLRSDAPHLGELKKRAGCR